jgi:hypothetical protein
LIYLFSPAIRQCQGLEQATLCGVAYVRMPAVVDYRWWHLFNSRAVVFLIYLDSYLFVFATAVLQFGIGVDSALGICEAAILLCLVCYVTTKVRSSQRFRFLTGANIC